MVSINLVKIFLEHPNHSISENEANILAEKLIKFSNGDNNLDFDSFTPFSEKEIVKILFDIYNKALKEQ